MRVPKPKSVKSSREHAMRNPAVHDDSRANAMLKRMNTGEEFGDHAVGGGVCVDEFLSIVKRKLTDEVFLFVENAVYVGKKKESARLKSRGERACETVTVDVECVLIVVVADGRNDGDISRVAENIDDIRVEGGGIANKSEFFRIDGLDSGKGGVSS